jgi:cobyrinic acid a,c-diamide synthase
MSAGLGPRLVVAAPTSGAGKTTFTTGLLAALARTGTRVAAAKVGPDFIDPGYHGLATGRPGRNLDAWISGPAAVPALAARAAAGADMLVVEGVMGLFDGASWVPAELAGQAGLRGPNAEAGLRGPNAETGPTADPRLTFASTAHVAALLDAPVLLVLDATATSGSVAPVVHGFATWAPGVRIGGVILNRVGSDTHEAMLRAAMAPTGIPVLGAVRRDPAIAWPDRHLGLVPVAERAAEARATIDRLAAGVAAGCDLGAIARLARSAPVMVPAAACPPTARVATGVRVAVAAGPAFSFTYADNLERLAEAGAELVPFDPLTDRSLPPGVSGLVAGGGFPEVHGEALADNEPLLGAVRTRIAGGLVTWAECGGLLWLAGALDGRPMVGAVPTEARMTGRLHLGYRRATATAANPVLAPGTSLRGHVFHYTATEPGGAALAVEGRSGAQAEGFASPTLLATYLHAHLGADPGPAERFVAACASAAVPESSATHA